MEQSVAWALECVKYPGRCWARHWVSIRDAWREKEWVMMVRWMLLSVSNLMLLFLFLLLHSFIFLLFLTVCWMLLSFSNFMLLFYFLLVYSFIFLLFFFSSVFFAFHPILKKWIPIPAVSHLDYSSLSSFSCVSFHNIFVYFSYPFYIY